MNLGLGDPILLGILASELHVALEEQDGKQTIAVNSRRRWYLGILNEAPRGVSSRRPVDYPYAKISGYTFL